MVWKSKWNSVNHSKDLLIQKIHVHNINTLHFYINTKIFYINKNIFKYCSLFIIIIEAPHRSAWLAIFFFVHTFKSQNFCEFMKMKIKVGECVNLWKWKCVNACNDIFLCPFTWNPYFPLNAWMREKEEKNLRDCVIGLGNGSYGPYGGASLLNSTPLTYKI